MGWVDGKSKMVPERYVGTAADVEALLDGREEAMVPRADPAPGFRCGGRLLGLLDDLGVAGPGSDAAVTVDEFGAGGPEPGHRHVFEARAGRVVEEHHGGPVHQDRCLLTGPPPVLRMRCTPCPPGRFGGYRGEDGAGDD